GSSRLLGNRSSCHRQIFRFCEAPTTYKRAWKMLNGISASRYNTDTEEQRCPSQSFPSPTAFAHSSATQVFKVPSRPVMRITAWAGANLSMHQLISGGSSVRRSTEHLHGRRSMTST